MKIDKPEQRTFHRYAELVGALPHYRKHEGYYKWVVRTRLIHGFGVDKIYINERTKYIRKLFLFKPSMDMLKAMSSKHPLIYNASLYIATGRLDLERFQ